jgi:mannosyltransferase
MNPLLAKKYSFFYDIPALQKYKWYWRVEPDISFTCSITYDPFYEMQKNDKRYGWVVALWEIETTVPTLFRRISEYKKKLRLPNTNMWKAMIQPSRVPWPFRRLFMSGKPGRDENGDMWNFCHFWSNFEIADMDWFRSPEYRGLFDYLDQDGGFYYERWGDAPIHSLAAALLLRADQVHHFSDWGYIHGDFQWCPYGPTIDNMKMFQLARGPDGKNLADVQPNLGCNCKCDPDISEVAARCYNSFRSPVA